MNNGHRAIVEVIGTKVDGEWREDKYRIEVISLSGYECLHCSEGGSREGDFENNVLLGYIKDKLVNIKEYSDESDPLHYIDISQSIDAICNEVPYVDHLCDILGEKIMDIAAKEQIDEVEEREKEKVRSEPLLKICIKAYFIDSSGKGPLSFSVPVGTETLVMELCPVGTETLVMELCKKLQYERVGYGFADRFWEFLQKEIDQRSRDEII